MNKTSLVEMDLAVALERVGILLAPDQLPELVPGVAIVQRLIERVNMPLPGESEPAVMFSSDNQR